MNENAGILKNLQKQIEINTKFTSNEADPRSEELLKKCLLEKVVIKSIEFGSAEQNSIICAGLGFRRVVRSEKEGAREDRWRSRTRCPS